MPPKKKPVATAAADYMQMSSDVTKHSLEIPVKQIDTKSLMKIEKIGSGLEEKLSTEKQKSPYRKVKSFSKAKTFSRAGKTKKTFSKTSTAKITKTPLAITKTKHEDYELIITEKPQAAQKIATALADSNSLKQEKINSVPYYEITHNKKPIVITCAVGHLFTITQAEGEKRSIWPAFNITWQPNYLKKGSEYTARYFAVINGLQKKASSFTIATDYDIEGEVIGRNILKYLCKQEDAKRMKFSSLTKNELVQAYENPEPTINWGQAIAGETRHYLDWMYGINLSRALMESIKAAGSFKIMSIGRVQGPALNLIVKKEIEIRAFKSTPYWQVFIEILDKKNQKAELKYVKDIVNKTELEKFRELKGKTATAETTLSKRVVSPPVPFNLTNLQTEAYSNYGITPSRTLEIAQRLYLAGLISYPRTSSQKIPEAIEPKKIIKKLESMFPFTKFVTRSTPVEGEKADPAHPSIYPTGEIEVALNEEDKKIYNLIVRRFIACFCDDAVLDDKKIAAIVNDLKFTTTGSAIKTKGWMEVYPSKHKEKEIPTINGEVSIINQKIEEKETQPPSRFSPASIVSELEKRNLGTKATRSNILETLYSREYIKDQSITATPLGISLIRTMEKYSPVIIDENLTRDFEEQMEEIEKIKKHSGQEKREEELIGKAKKVIEDISGEIKKNLPSIGKGLIEANVELREIKKAESIICKCPICNKGFLALNFSPKTKKRFIACNAYPECKTIFSIPQMGMVKKADKECEHCGYPMIMLLKKGRKPWFLCFNNKCPDNIKRLEEYRAKMAGQENAKAVPEPEGEVDESSETEE